MLHPHASTTYMYPSHTCVWWGMWGAPPLHTLTTYPSHICVWWGMYMYCRVCGEGVWVEYVRVELVYAGSLQGFWLIWNSCRGGEGTQLKVLYCILGQDVNNSDTLYLSVSVHVPLAHPPLTQWRIRGQKKKGKEWRGSGHVLERCSSNSTLNPSPWK